MKKRGFNKKGVSTIIVTIILVALVLIAIGIVWAVIGKMLSQSSKDISLERLTIDTEIKGVGINESNNNSISVLVKRKPGEGSLSGFNFVFKNETDSELKKIYTNLTELQEKVFTFNLDMNVSQVIKINLIPVIKSGDKEIYGSITVEYNVQGGSLVVPSGGGNETDTTPPVRSNGAPTGNLSSGTTQTIISLNTNEAATCKYDTNSGTAYALMSYFSTTGGTSHSKLITGLSDGNDYNYYVKCNDSAENINTDDYAINFSVSSGTFQISFVAPTPPNASNQSNTDVYVNISTSISGEHSAWIDWDRSLVGWWTMDFYNDSGIYDNSTWNNFGTFSAGMSTNNANLSGARGGAFTFSGVHYSGAEYIDIGNSFYSQKFTIETWAKPTESTPLDDWGVIISNFHVREIDAYNNNFVCYVGDGDSWANQNAVSAENYIPNQWQHVVCTFNGSTVTIYVDGIKGGSVVPDRTPPASSSTIARIGCVGGSDAYCFNGSIDEVKVWNRVLTPEEINASYNAGLYKLYHNFTNLPNGNYNYRAYAIDSLGTVSNTEQRTVTIV